MAGPAEFAIHRRGGRTRKVGRGISFVCLPFFDRYYLVPSTAHSVSFAADQITAENQGVEVAGFAVWRVTDPEKVSASFDFDARDAALEAVNHNLQNVVESAIRHQVAKMTIEDVLRKRGSIILQLKEELAYIAGLWGIEIETVEIRTVQVLSKQLFAQMQARFRDVMRLESETSGMETECQITERRLAQREETAAKEREFQRRELERSTEAERAKIAADNALRALRLETETGTVSAERALHEASAILETARQQHRAALALIDDEATRRQIETANREDRALAFIKALPAIAEGLAIHELNLGEDLWRTLGRGIARLTEKEASHE